MVPYPRVFKMLDFHQFSGKEEQSTVKHVSQFVVQCGDASHDNCQKVRLFPLLLFKIAFTWYTSLLINSVHSLEYMKI